MGSTLIVTEHSVITLQGQEVAYFLSRVRSRKSLTVQVNAQGELHVRIPWRVTLSQTEHFIRDHAPWVLQRLQLANKAMASRPILKEGSILPFLDTSLLLCYGTVQIRPIFREEDRLWVSGPDHSPQTLIKRLEQWYRSQAQQHLALCLEDWSNQLGLRFERMMIRDQKSRWGSCSAKKTISLNWRLMFMPTRVVDYVMIHELCHLRHMNHSAEFWAMVGGIIPEYAKHRHCLRLFSSPW